MNNKLGHVIAFLKGAGSGLLVGSVLLFIIVGVIMLLSSKAEAAVCDEVYLGAWSYHIHDERELNETHYLLGCEKNGYFAAVMKNSHGNPTAMGGKMFDLFETGDFKSVVYLGLHYGYYGCTRNDLGTGPTLCPMVIPEISYTKYHVKPTLVLLGNAVAFTFKVSI